MIARRALCLVAALLVLSGVPVWACKLPVFRYALERWTVDRYRMVAIVAQPDEVSTQDALSVLRSLDGDDLNMEIEIVDLSQLSESEWWQVEGIEEGITANRLQVFYPPRSGSSKKCWDGELTSTHIQAWCDSPFRKILANDLVSGVSAVWIQVDGSDGALNDRVAEDLETALGQAESEIMIPEGVIPREEAAEYLRLHPEASMDDVLRCDVPLKVEFRLRRLSRDDPVESATLAMIDGLSDERERPVLVPVFGRGRMLDAIATERVNSESILAACRYMVSECSCTVKALNPGTDMLLKVNWQRSLGENIVMVDLGVPQNPRLIEIPTGALPNPSSAAPQAARDDPSLANSDQLRGYGMGIVLALSLSVSLFYWRKRRQT